MNCVNTLTGKTSELDLDQTIDFLEPQDDRPDPTNPAVLLPARAGAICQSADDWGKLKTALETACRLLGRRCSYETRKSIEDLGAILSRPARTSR